MGHDHKWAVCGTASPIKGAVACAAGSVGGDGHADLTAMRKTVDSIHTVLQSEVFWEALAGAVLY